MFIDEFNPVKSNTANTSERINGDQPVSVSSLASYYINSLSDVNALYIEGDRFLICTFFMCQFNTDGSYMSTLIISSVSS